MKTFTIVIKSKNIISKKNFLSAFKEITSNNSFSVKKQFPKKVRIQKVTILKSPHVNKSSQEQFETRFFETQFTIKNIKIFKYLILLKKLNFNLFSDVDLVLKYNIQKKSTKKLSLKIFTPENFKFNKFSDTENFNIKWKLLKETKSFKKFLIHKKTNLLLKIWDSHGELLKYMFE